jgi:hypothetical protein
VWVLPTTLCAAAPIRFDEFRGFQTGPLGHPNEAAFSAVCGVR